MVLSHPRRDDPFPVEAVRDLLGIARSLYRAERDGAGDPVRLQELVEIGKLLKLALRLSKPGPGTLGHIAAWRWAGEGTERLGALVGADELTAACVSATVKVMEPRR